MDKLSVVVPAYNEADGLKRRCRSILGQEVVAEVVIVEDGCTDRTPEVASELEEQLPSVGHVHFDRRQGKGQALLSGFEHASKDRIAFLDADRSIDAEILCDLSRSLDEGADIAIGVRGVEDTVDSRRFQRRTLSHLYNLLADVVLGPGISDRQCGAKAFRLGVLGESYSSKGWFWDTEFLFRAKRRGFEISEVPIDFRVSEDEGNVPDMVEELGTGLIRISLTEETPLKKYLKFAGIGALGAVINQVVLTALTELAGLHYIVSAATGIEFAILVMFFLNNSLTFETTLEGFQEVVRGLVTSNIVRSAGIAVQLSLLYFLTELGNIHYFISNLVAIGFASVLNFVGEHRFTWKDTPDN